MCCCRLAKGDVTPTERFQLQRRLLAQDNIVSCPCTSVLVGGSNFKTQFLHRKFIFCTAFVSFWTSLRYRLETLCCSKIVVIVRSKASRKHCHLDVYVSYYLSNRAGLVFDLVFFFRLLKKKKMRLITQGKIDWSRKSIWEFCLLLCHFKLRNYKQQRPDAAIVWVAKNKAGAHT